MPIHTRRLLLHPTLHPIRPGMVRPPELKVQARDSFPLRIVGVISRLHSKPLVRENQKFGPCRFWLAHSLNTLMGKAIASGPKGILRARRALWVVHTFFVRASDNPLSYDSGARCVRLEEG